MARAKWSAHHLLLSVLVAGTSWPAPVAGQNAYVYYDHSPRVEGGRISYRVAETGSRLSRGTPPRLKVPSGGNACFQVTNANLLLYTYSLGQQAIARESPEGLADILKSLTTIAAALKVDAPERLAPETPASDPAEKYAEAIDSLAKIGDALAALRGFSDNIPDFGVVFDSSRKLLEAGTRQRNVTTALFEKGKGETQKVVFMALRKLDDAAFTAIQNLKKQYDDANTGVDELCVKTKDTDLAISLVIKRPGAAKDAKSARPVDTVATMTVEVTHSKTFDIVPLAVAILAVRNARHFVVEGGSIRDRGSPSPGVQPGTLALARLGASVGWIGVGASTSQGSLAPALHFALVLRPTALGIPMLLGAGPTITQVTVDLKDGAVAGGALPAGKTIDDVALKAHRLGAAVYFVLGDLSFLGGKSK